MRYKKEEFLSDLQEKLINNNYEDWIWSIIEQYQKILSDYEKRSSWLPPEVSEILGENRERKFLINFINTKISEEEEPLNIKLYKELLVSINNVEHQR